MLNNSTPIPFSKNLVNFQEDNEILTYNNTIPPIYDDKNITSRNSNKPKKSEDDIIPRLINTYNKNIENYNKYYNKYSYKEDKKEKENYSNNYYSLNANNSLYNDQQTESVIIRDNCNSSSPKMNSDKMTLSELNNPHNNYSGNKNSSMNSNRHNKNIINNEFNKKSKEIQNNIDSINIDNTINNNSDGIHNDNDKILNKNADDAQNNIDNYNLEEDDVNGNYDDCDNEEQKNYNYENEEVELEEFLNDNNNKNIISQKENEYILFDMNKTINEDDKNKISINTENYPNEVLNNNNIENEANKRNFFSKILDIEILIDTNEIYTKPWSQLINNIYNKCESDNDSIQLISLGSQHTLCISNKGKLYSFGWNNYCQCGKKSKMNKVKLNDNIQIEKIEDVNEIIIDEKIKINDISCGEDHSLIITDGYKIYGFGLNNSGQLCYDPKKHRVISKPSLIKSFKKSLITNVQCTDNISFILNDMGEAFICPWEDKKNQMHYIPIKLFFPLKPKIVSISCGDNFTIFLSEKGNVYSMGSNNKYGQLGLGDTEIQLSPKMIYFFKNNKIKISQISCGYCHVLALDENGNAYSWGFGSEGQLGLGEEVLVNNTPNLINYFSDNQIFIFQVSSGYHSSYFLTENNSIYICGTNGRDCNKDFIPKNSDIKIKYKDLVKYPCWICRILNCWNRSMSIFYAIFLDCHFINKDDEEVNKVLNLISKKWVHQTFSSTIMEGINSMNQI